MCTLVGADKNWHKQLLKKVNSSLVIQQYWKTPRRLLYCATMWSSNIFPSCLDYTPYKSTGVAIGLHWDRPTQSTIEEIFFYWLKKTIVGILYTRSNSRCQGLWEETHYLTEWLHKWWIILNLNNIINIHKQENNIYVIHINEQTFICKGITKPSRQQRRVKLLIPGIRYLFQEI